MMPRRCSMLDRLPPEMLWAASWFITVTRSCYAARACRCHDDLTSNSNGAPPTIHQPEGALHSQYTVQKRQDVR